MHSFALASRSFNFSSMSTWIADNFTLAEVTFASSCSTSLSCSATALPTRSVVAKASSREFFRKANLAFKRCFFAATSMRVASIKSAMCDLTSSGASSALPSSLALACGGTSPLLLDCSPLFSSSPISLTRLRLQGLASANVSSAKRSLDLSIDTSLTKRSCSSKFTCIPLLASARLRSASRARRQASLSTLLRVSASTSLASFPVACR
mmetsp:Transcript_75953/g.180613  ORF Transcript_75953/g.180613 Transcript_75953/m.180613 type:complete len:209 (+) Transcript_75953:1357-1983(+)